jgi:hypothetical protein
MAKENANTLITDHRAQYKSPDVMGEGINSLMMEKMGSGGSGDDVAMDGLEDGEVEDDCDMDRRRRKSVRRNVIIAA